MIPTRVSDGIEIPKEVVATVEITLQQFVGSRLASVHEQRRRASVHEQRGLQRTLAARPERQKSSSLLVFFTSSFDELFTNFGFSIPLF